MLPNYYRDEGGASKSNQEPSDREMFETAQTKSFGKVKVLLTKLFHDSRNFMFS